MDLRYTADEQKFRSDLSGRLASEVPELGDKLALSDNIGGDPTACGIAQLGRS